MGRQIRLRLEAYCRKKAYFFNCYIIHSFSQIISSVPILLKIYTRLDYIPKEEGSNFQ